MFNRNDRPADPKDAAKPTTTPPKPQFAPAMPAAPTAPAMPRASAPMPPLREPQPPMHASVEPPPMPTTTLADGSGSKLIVGVNIRLKGVEISNCDVLVIEGQVEATVNSKAMEIAKPGTLSGTAMIDVAEIHGEFSGELTARTKLVVHGTGRVTGTIRYGKLVVAEGGMLNGDLRQIDAQPGADTRSAAVSAPSAPDMRALLHPQPASVQP